MLFSNPDYPIFLIAVFFMYALARGRDALGFWARAALLLALGDLVFLLVAKDIDTLWDPIGGWLWRTATVGGHDEAWRHWTPYTVLVKWPIGLLVVGGSIYGGMRSGPWLTSEKGQRTVARGIVIALAVVGAVVAFAWWQSALDGVTRVIAAHSHLLVLSVLGVGIGLSRDETHRPLSRVITLFVASSLFYQAWAIAMPGPYRYLLGLLLGTIILDYYLAIWIERSEDPAKRKLLVVVSLVSNLGILFFFKYADFVTQDVLQLPVSRLNLILPAGISFHTFQSLSYTIDVYRKELKATRSPIEFATFVLFFPQLVAGPIVRAQDLLPQLHQLPGMEVQRATRGLYRIVVGLFKKIALADTFALFIADRVFENPTRFSSLEVLVGVYAYALQIYCDFSAYSDIAIGSADVLGFKLPENFRTPYRSANLQEFWRRWHISLSTWLRDYLYITLGGSRGAEWRTYLNLALTMVLGGLWHGASWAFIVWGGLHGFGLAVTRYFQRATAVDAKAAWQLFAGCAGFFAVGYTVQTQVFPSAMGTWTNLVIAWLYATPLWAVLTAWLSREPSNARARAAQPDAHELDVREPDGRVLGTPVPLGIAPWQSRIPQARLRDRGVLTLVPELLRFAMCGAGALFLAALEWGEQWTWLPLIALTWALALAADIVERGPAPRLHDSRLVDFLLKRLAVARRAVAVILVFHYVCFAWIFFRAGSFDTALAVLEQIAKLELDHANIVPVLTTALAVGFACHFFAEGSFRWLRERWAMLPWYVQGTLLAAVALVLRELAHPKVVPIIYFQF
ncbi:MAG TPA: MBOAT family O-acyltransferase [Kofleriaceae bacterium]|nr:MBOAT family O-acyltransferase [Kofleriaceae bacterium]